MLSRRAFFAGSALLVMLGPLQAAPIDPKAHLTALYARITAGKGDAGGQQYWANPSTRAKTFSAGVVALWAKAEAKAKAMDDVGPIDFDPFTNSQDPQVKSATVELLEQQEKTAKLRVVLSGPGYSADDKSEGTLVVDLVREGEAWKIDDIWGSVAGDPWSLRGLLSMQ